MPRGGKRAGAGRKPGGKCQKTLDRLGLTKDVAAGGITPLALLLEHMRALWKEGTKESKAEAVKVADIVCGYVHPRLSAVDVATEETIRHVVRVPAKSASVEEWISDYIDTTTPPTSVQ